MLRSSVPSASCWRKGLKSRASNPRKAASGRKGRLRLEKRSSDDTLISAKIAAAENWIGKFIGHALDDATPFPDGTPEPLKEAVRQLVAHLYENREATLVGNTLTITDVFPGLSDLMAPFRDYVF